jgi:predicted Rossmann fold nucleotide-binding protein DprA/Smf involved in DNA uptake
LREDAPAVLYGCGDISLLETGGLAVVGSRDVEDTLIEYTMAVGGLAARAGRTLVSGGAKGIDQAAMRGALEAGGTVIGVLADSLEKTAMNRDHRNLVIDGRLVLTSPYDPSAGFNVGNAMQRNKIIYALADASLVVSSNINKGGTWAGAIEQLDKLRLVPVYVRSTGEASEGLEALRRKGAIDWPNPQDADAFEAIFDIATSTKTPQVALSLGSNDVSPVAPSNTLPVTTDTEPVPHAAKEPSQPFSSPRKEQHPEPKQRLPTVSEELEVTSNDGDSLPQAEMSPADALFSAARDEIQRLLKAPMKGAEVAAALEVSTAQAKAWLQRLVKEGVLEKQKKPVVYIVKQSHLFE